MEKCDWYDGFCVLIELKIEKIVKNNSIKAKYFFLLNIKKI